MTSEFLKVPSSTNEGTLPQPELPDDLPPPEDPRLTPVKSEAAKMYLRENWKSMFDQHQLRRVRTTEFKESLRSRNLPRSQQAKLEKEFADSEMSRARLGRVKMSIKDFDKIHLIGRGGSGEVWLVRHLVDDNLYAMKIVSKMDVLVNDQAASVRTERNLLSTIDNPWVVKLFYTFQDSANLYFVMEFIQGGDLCSLLSRSTVLSEENARFYIAEIAIALHQIHKLGFVHRDVKPDNMLITTTGHIKLADFGLSVNEHTDVRWQRLIDQIKAIVAGTEPSETQIQVGTIDYVAPEVLLDEGFSKAADWWSLGIIAYELLYGVKPFSGATQTETAINIIRYQQKLEFPGVPKLSKAAKSFLRGLIKPASERLNFKKIKNHKFFRGFHWDSLLSQAGPIVPEFSSPFDVSHFDPVLEEDTRNPVIDEQQTPDALKYAFLGFTYKSTAPKSQAIDLSLFEEK